MKRKALRLDRLTRAQHCWNFRFHGDVGARNDQADAISVYANKLLTDGYVTIENVADPAALDALYEDFDSVSAKTPFCSGDFYGAPFPLRNGTERSAQLLGRYGYGKAIVLARFIPVVRTVLNPMAGALDVPVRTFTLWQVVGGVIWSAGVVLAGYALGSTIPSIDTYLLPIIAVIVIVSLIPVGLELLRARRAGRGPDGDSDSATGSGSGAGSDSGTGSGSGTGTGSGTGSGTSTATGGSDATVRS